MSESDNAGKPFDPLAAWRGIRNESMDAWAKAMTEAVNTEQYAQTSGAMLDAYLTASIPFNEMLKKAMAQALQQANMPSRADLISVAERLTQVEMRLDDLDAKLDESAKRQTGTAEKKKSKDRDKDKEGK
jgi:polyhydroxyalkanoic acid synthase PhaR subunit